MSLGQFFPTNETMSPFSMYISFESIPKLVPLEHFEEDTPGAKIHVIIM